MTTEGEGESVKRQSDKERKESSIWVRERERNY